MRTRAQTAATKMLLDALHGVATDDIPDTLLSSLPDILKPEQLERLGDRLARAGHYKGRSSHDL